MQTDEQDEQGLPDSVLGPFDGLVSPHRVQSAEEELEEVSPGAAADAASEDRRQRDGNESPDAAGS